MAFEATSTHFAECLGSNSLGAAGDSCHADSGAGGEHAHFFELYAHPSTIADLIMDVIIDDPIYGFRQRVTERYTWRTVIDELTGNLNAKGR